MFIRCVRSLFYCLGSSVLRKRAAGSRNHVWWYFVTFVASYLTDLTHQLIVLYNSVALWDHKCSPNATFLVLLGLWSGSETGPSLMHDDTSLHPYDHSSQRNWEADAEHVFGYLFLSLLEQMLLILRELTGGCFIGDRFRYISCTDGS